MSQTVEQFANRFKKSLDVFIKDLVTADIGIKKAADSLTNEEFVQMAKFYRSSSNSPKKKEKLNLVNTTTLTAKKSPKNKVVINVQGGKKILNKNAPIKKPTKMQATEDKQKHQKLFQELKEKQLQDKEQKKKENDAKLKERIQQNKDNKNNKNIASTNEQNKTDNKKIINPDNNIKEEPQLVIKKTDKLEQKEDIKSLEKELTQKKKKKKNRRRGGKKRNEIDVAIANRDKLHLSPEKMALHNKNKKQKSVVSIKTKHEFEKPVEPQIKKIKIYNHNDISNLAQQMSLKVGDVIKQLMKMGVMSTINQAIDRDTATLLVEDLKHTASQESDDNQLEKDIQEKINKKYSDKITRAPIVTVMGHVDHGKTSLLDYIRQTKVSDSESGGITQHIGAYHVETKKGMVTFLDTPGHAAFSAMRSRGADLTDIVILIVAADDGVKPQTVEAIEHAKSANAPIIVAINKIDKENANVEKVKQELSKLEVIPEDWGGENIFVEISAKTGAGIDDLLDNIILQAEVLELHAFSTGDATGIVVETSLDKGRGVMATLLVQNGTLKKSDIIVAGVEFGKVRTLFDENHHQLDNAGPALPASMLGFSSPPNSGDKFMVVKNERMARELTNQRHADFVQERQAANKPKTLDDFFANKKSDKVLNILVKADTHGSFEAIKNSLEIIKDKNDEISVKVFGGIGGIKKSDVQQAITAKAIIFGFNVRADKQSKQLIDENKLDLHYYSIIYELIDEVKAAASGLLSPQIKEQIIGTAKVSEVFRSQKLGDIAGCMVVDGKIKINAPIRVLRDNVVIYEGEVESLRRFKDEVKEVRMGTECGIGVKNYNEIKKDDKIEVYIREEIQQKIQ
ncbi:MAG: translation initiation factor IF-2 [Gammaproteobacteria bacterium]|nr:MAG: translation initiation factor IF-2 [Gammaproteobacteria bacterium]